MKTTNSELTIVTPAKNEEKFIGKLLDSILSQDYSDIASVPIYIADYPSTDHTREVVMRYRERLNVSVIKGGVPSVGRNRGAAMAKSEFVLFVDADVELRDPTMIRRALAFARSRNLVCITTHTRCLDDDLQANIIYELSNLLKHLSRFTIPYADGPFLFFNKRWFDEIGGFDERVVWAEDGFLVRKVPRKRFGVLPGYMYTSNRMLKRGFWRLIWLVIEGGFNFLIKNDEFFYRDHHYFTD